MHVSSDGSVIRFIAVVDDELLRGSEVTFDTVHPGSVGCDEDELDVVCVNPLNHFLFSMGGEVVEHDVEPSFLGVSSPNGFQERKDLLPPLPFLVMHPQGVFVNIIGCQEVTHSLEPRVGGSSPDGSVLGSPRTARLRLHLDGPKLVETDYGRPFRHFFVERLDPFFLAS